ncbi:SGNH/GDSL hydrolase family protein [Aeromicrobium halocynthiae]|uniref:SGNH/GDSL hydrolase family protein n=1 Tax=Aeromicrobium halocynthiae TaxID=560557 RepID=A0ABN2VWN3_9ACTN
MTFRRFVALGDSFTEGVGDPDPSLPNGVRGWADRVAAVLGERADGFGYVNLAIRGRKLRQVLAEQLEPALALEPDLVTIYAGGNDIMRPSVDLDALVAAYDDAIGRLTATGSRVVVFTAFDPAGFPIFAAGRGRFAIYNELVRESAERHGATLVDFWRMRDYRDQRMWADDRLHMSTPGHQRMAIAVLDALEVEHDLRPLPLPELASVSARERLAANRTWVLTHAGPWVKRRLTGTSSGDTLSPRWPAYER